MKVAEFETGRGEGVVHIDQLGRVRLELPGHYLVTSIFPGSGGNDKMNVNLVPQKEEE